jgi:mRNA interferase RelE/StbE
VGWTIDYVASVRKSLEKIDAVGRRRIRAYLEKRVATLDDPRQIGKPLTGDLGGLWRYRVGDYRIICELRDAQLVVLVVTVDHRKDVYR